MSTVSERVRGLGVVEGFQRFSREGPGLLAAAIAYNVFFSLAPLALAALGVAALVGRDDFVRAEIIDALSDFAPEDVVELVDAALQSAATAISAAHGPLIFVSLLVALYSGSRATATVMKALAIIEEGIEERKFWRVRGIGILLTLAGGVAFLLALIVLVVGGALVSWIEQAAGIDWLEPVWAQANLPLVAIALFLYLLAVYQWGPPEPLPWAWLAAVMATVGALLASLGFAWYLANVGSLGPVVGVVATVAVMLLWLFIGGYVIIASGFLAAEIARRRVPGRSGSTQSGTAEDPSP